MPEPGDVIKFKYWGFQHEAIVAYVQPDGSKEESSFRTTGRICVIHYALSSIFATRTIKEETLRFDLTEDPIYLKVHNGFVTYPRETVVKRARSRLGEQRFNIRSNTSSTFAFWAKINLEKTVTEN